MTFPYAKLTPPTLERIFPRTRLFRELDALESSPVTWISAPGGAGKTALVASYLAHRGIRPLWYQVDPADSDTASFFYFLGEGHAQLKDAGGLLLPSFTPEYQLGLPAFARHFFRELFATLPPPAVLVLDNIEAVREDSEIHEALRHGLEEVPRGGRVIVTGRCRPPPRYARLHLNGRLAQLGWDRLQVTDEESQGIIEVLTEECALPEDTVHRLQESARGWVAGLVLLLGQRKGGTAATTGFARQHFDDYFATEVFSHLPADTRTLLLRTAWLTTLRADTAAALSGFEDAGRVLDDLERQQMFVTTHAGNDLLYTYHPLLRSFLQAEAARSLSPRTLARLQRATADILAREGDPDEAVELYAHAGHWPELAKLIREQAPSLWRQGRARLLRRWLDRLPGRCLKPDPWLRYWYGNTALLAEPRDAGRHFEAALDGFEAAEDMAGLCLGLTGILDSIMYGNDSLAAAPRWLDVFDTLRPRLAGCPQPHIALRLEFTAFNLQFVACPERASPGEWQAWARHLETRLNTIPDDTLLCMSAVHLGMYYTWHPQPDRLALLADSLRKYADSEWVAPQARLLAYLVEITRHWLTARSGGTDAVIRTALQLMEDHGIFVTRLWLLSSALFCHLARRNLPASERLLTQFHRHVRPHNRTEQAHYHFLAGWLDGLRGEYGTALTHATVACEHMQSLHTPHFELLTRLLYCQTLVRLEHYEEAGREIATTRTLATHIHARHAAVFHLGLLEGWIAWRQDRTATALEHLRCALACGRELGLRVSPPTDPVLLAHLCALALAYGIETTYVRQLIQWNGLAMPEDARLLAAWPVAVRIYTLGRFAIRVHGRHLSRQPAHNKPIKLLQALIALGGREVADHRLEEALWPDAEGDAAHRTLITNLQRLRKLLGVHDVIRYHDGRLTLDPRHCWVDAWAFEQESHGTAVQTLALYRGPFLRDEGDDDWLLPLRQRLHALALRRCQHLLDDLAAESRWSAVVIHGQRALDLDPLHEPFYQALIRAHHQLGHRGEAMRAWRLCQQRLRHALGTEPSSRTRALAEETCSAGMP
ncbi:MAG TPA: hypothetical protein ENJ79_03850 [Gammaproteobacteria bacterium]|nr:hypothetical protein [Gammaproteobacteria bacterium]